MLKLERTDLLRYNIKNLSERHDYAQKNQFARVAEF
jgi:hypothetical protein